MIQAWIVRVLALAAAAVIFLLALRGAAELWNWLAGSPEQAFSGAQLIEDGKEDPDGLLIAVDAGHGGKDQGTCAGNILEKDINLAVARKLEEELAKRGAGVLMIRTGDVKVELEERAKVANEAGADLFVSIHCNYYEDSAQIKGLECYYKESSADGEALADRISEAFEDVETVENRGVKTADYRVLRKTDMPAVLVELGYMSNPAECRMLTDEDYQKLLAETIAEAVMDQ